MDLLAGVEFEESVPLLLHFNVMFLQDANTQSLKNDGAKDALEDDSDSTHLLIDLLGDERKNKIGKQG